MTLPTQRTSSTSLPPALRKLSFQFLSHWMGYDHGDSFPFDFEPNGFPFGSKLKGKLSPRSYSIQFERKYSFFSAKRLPDRLTGVRENSVSRHQRDPIEGPLETRRTSQHFHVEGIKGFKYSFLSACWARVFFCLFKQLYKVRNIDLFFLHKHTSLKVCCLIGRSETLSLIVLFTDHIEPFDL